MATIKDVMIYICNKYPYKEELSKARLTKMIYLADWKSAIQFGKQITEIKWLFNHYGPYVDDVFNTALNEDEFIVDTILNSYGHSKDVISINQLAKTPILSQNETEILNDVINTTKMLNFTDFVRLVYSTYPVSTQNRYEKLNLPRLANEWKQIKNSI